MSVEALYPSSTLYPSATLFPGIQEYDTPDPSVSITLKISSKYNIALSTSGGNT